MSEKYALQAKKYQLNNSIDQILEMFHEAIQAKQQRNSH